MVDVNALAEQLEVLALCPLCGNLIDARRPYFSYKSDDDTVYAHTQCSGATALIDGWGLMLRLEKINEFIDG